MVLRLYQEGHRKVEAEAEALRSQVANLTGQLQTARNQIAQRDQEIAAAKVGLCGSSGLHYRLLRCCLAWAVGLGFDD